MAKSRGIKNAMADLRYGARNGIVFERVRAVAPVRKTVKVERKRATVEEVAAAMVVQRKAK